MSHLEAQAAIAGRKKRIGSDSAGRFLGMPFPDTQSPAPTALKQMFENLPRISEE